jgi:hypothetical protein
MVPWRTISAEPAAGFDLIYEPADKLNHNLASLNRVYEKTIKAIHDIDPQRMIFIAPRLRAAPEDLSSLKLPAHSQNYLLAEWHIFPWGPLKNNGKYPWTSGTAAEKAAIHNRINTALHWQQKTGHVSWVGAGAWVSQRRRFANGIRHLYGLRAAKGENPVCA